MLDTPIPSNSRLSDLRHYLLHRPEVPTLVPFVSEEARIIYQRRMTQRVGIDFSPYAILNVHGIGVDAPGQFVYEELMKWGETANFWPNHLALAERRDARLEKVDVYLLGRKEYPFGWKRGPFGLNLIPLFRLKALKIKSFPSPRDTDNDRFLLYESSGGYPIGHFILYVRSSIPTEGETGPTQLFMAVGFNFYGRERKGRYWLFKRSWEPIHNRVTSNVLNRFKRLCEDQFRHLQDGI